MRRTDRGPVPPPAKVAAGSLPPEAGAAPAFRLPREGTASLGAAGVGPAAGMLRLLRTGVPFPLGRRIVPARTTVADKLAPPAAILAGPA